MTASPSSVKGSEMCSRCNVEMTLQSRWEGSESLGWYCPCCKSVLRTIALLNADADRHAEEMGLTREEYEAHMEEQVKQIVRKPTERDMEQAQAWAERMDAEWTPVCPHDTNPWRPPPSPEAGLGSEEGA